VKSDVIKKGFGKKWFTRELKSVRDSLMFLYDCFKFSKGTDREIEYKNTYLEAKKQYKAKVKEAKQKFHENYILNSKNKCKAAWNIIKNEANLHAQNIERKIDSNSFNDYFVNSVARTVDINIENQNIDSAIQFLNNYVQSLNVNNHVFKWKHINVNDVLNYVSKLSSSCSEDAYGFSNRIIKEIIDIIAEPLTFLFNCILDQGVYPSVLKVVKVTPIFKKGDKSCPSNYRPISLVPIFSKIFESCIKEQLYDYFAGSELLCKQQFGFLPGRNTIKTVESVVEKILKNIDNKKISSATLIDLSKAFDSISHDLLLRKLYCYGVKDKELSLMISYLSGRKQMVVQGSDVSTCKVVQTGVPQGSVLGPFLFVIAVNDFAHNIPCTSILYADDTTLLNSDKDLVTLKMAQKNSMKTALDWFNVNFLNVNNEKTENIFFSLGSIDCSENPNSVKLLGVHLDSKLSWNVHTSNLCTKLSRVTYLLRKLSLCVNRNMLITSYFAFFQSLLLYGITLWGNSSGALRVFMWQKKVVRIIKNVSSRQTCRPIFKELEIMTVPSLYIYCSLIKVKENLDDYEIRQDIHDHDTRSKLKLNLLPVRLEKYKKNHCFMEIKIFNKLPLSARTANLNSFNSSLRNDCIMKAFKPRVRCKLEHERSECFKKMADCKSILFCKRILRM
jgi:hypothetical protein